MWYGVVCAYVVGSHVDGDVCIVVGCLIGIAVVVVVGVAVEVIVGVDVIIVCIVVVEYVCGICCL